VVEGPGDLRLYKHPGNEQKESAPNSTSKQNPLQRFSFLGNATSEKLFLSRETKENTA
jgi:hypothetical protein